MTFLQWMREQRVNPTPAVIYPRKKKTFIEKQRAKPIEDRLVICLNILRNISENTFLTEECDDLILTIEEYKEK